MSEKQRKHIRPFIVRSAKEEHRAATQLELLFDLVFVIAIAAAAHGLRHAITSGHVEAGIIQFAMAFFMVWWPWNLHTWFASSFDMTRSDGAAASKIQGLWALRLGASEPEHSGSLQGSH